MFALSFRIKLLLVMMLLVAGVTAATLYATQKIVQAAYLKLFQDQFATELNYFSEQQATRLGYLKGPCQALAQSGPLHEALRKSDAARVYQIATQELGEVPALRAGRNAARARANTPEETGLKIGTFLRVLNGRGEILRVAKLKAGRNQQVVRKKLEQQLAQVQKAMDSLDAQEIGFLSRETDSGRTNLWEMIVTKIADPTNHQTLGALVVGTVFIDAAESAMNQMSQKTIQTGILLEDKIYSKTIPENLRGELMSRVVEAQTKSAGKPIETFTDTLGGAQQRVFVRLLNPNSPFPPAYQISVYSLAGAARTQDELRWQILGFSLLALLAALVVSLLFSHGLSVPLREVAGAAEAIRAGDLAVRVPVRSRDEVGKLAESFNEMADGLGQRERYRTLLNMVADEKVAKALVDGQLALGGELRDISVLFCDIRGFTAYTQNMPPEEVIEMLNEHMTVLTRVVKEHNGVLDKFVGDLLMAIFGAPVSYQNDTLNAALCALALVRQREQLNATSRHQLKIGIGIATGRVVAGCMGSSDRLNYTVLGERVNLASRLCSQAGPGQIVIDQATRDMLGSVITATPLPALNLKGFSENVVAYELKGVQVAEHIEQMG